ncbi:hypothetical protein MHYP_G00257330 [Metynnis hypsauchen]
MLLQTQRINMLETYSEDKTSHPDRLYRPPRIYDGTQKSRFLEQTRYYRPHCGERSSSLVLCTRQLAHSGCVRAVTASGLDQHPKSYDPLQLMIA